MQPASSRRSVDRPEILVLGIILFSLMLRLVALACVGLGMDESYTLAVSRTLSLSYFDHPPLHLWLAHALAPALGYGRLARLPFVALFALSSWLLFLLTRRLFGERAGVMAVFALNVSAFFAVAAGGWVLPDGPLFAGMLAAALTLARVLFPASGEAERPWRDWLLTGLWIGLAALSKYQGLLFGLGAALLLISTARGRAWLRRPEPWMAALLAVAVFSPVLIWNARHGWASFVFQGSRGAPTHGLRLLAPLEAILGQAALLTPWIFVPVAVAAFRAARVGPARGQTWFCLMLGAPAIVVFTLTPLFGDRALPHWSMAGWLMLFPLLGEWLARASETRRWPRIWIAGSAAVFLLAWGLFVSEAATGWVGRLWPEAARKGEPTLETASWNGLVPELKRQGLLRPGTFVVSAQWMEAGKLHLALDGTAPVRLFSEDARQFAFTDVTADLVGHDALIVGRPNNIAERVPTLRAYFRELGPVRTIYVGRGGQPEQPLSVIEAHDLLRPYAGH